MKKKGQEFTHPGHGFGYLLVFLLIGGILGGIAGEALYAVPALQSIMPALAKHYEIFNIQNVQFNLYVMEVQFGLHLAPNLLSLAGMLLAVLVYRRFR